MRRGGFTLLEAMVALGVILLLVGAMTSVVRDVARARDRARLEGMRMQGVNAAFELLGSAADTCFAGDGESGIQGDAVNIRLTRSGVQARRLFGAGDDASPLTDRESFQLGLEGRDLVVGEQESGPSSVLIADLAAIRFRYFNGSDWLDSWNSNERGLPHSIELSIWTTPWPEGVVPEWMPQEEIEVAEDAQQPSAEAVVAEFDSTYPPPQKQRIVAIFDPAAPGDGIDGFSTVTEDAPGDFSP